MAFVTRFAPSPTGPLHLGHAYSALHGFDMAMREGGDWLVRIEDIDFGRSRKEWEQSIFDDLDWLGLWWPEPVMRQSERGKDYQDALERLRRDELLFGCRCARAYIAATLSAPQEGDPPLEGPDGPVYPGHCKPLRKDWSDHLWSADYLNAPSIRLDMTEAAKHGDWRAMEGHVFEFRETGQGPNGEHGLIAFNADYLIRNVGDVVLARRGMGTSYHLSVVLDDAAQGVTDVVRGQDLFEATKIHVLLQHLFGLPTPTYHHHRLIRDDQGKRLAKRDDARALSKYRAEGATPADIRRMVGLPNP
jgi:glutamyl-Q tRNA(Asp) synthetase